MNKWKGGLKMVDVIDVASYILTKTGRITTMVLQKLCYYSQASYLAKYGKPLFPEEFEAWRNGPVCYRLFKEHQGKFFIMPGELSKRATESDFTDRQLEVINAVCQKYGKTTGQKLSQKTHQETPWLDGREGLAPFDVGYKEIPMQTMRQYYSANPVI